MDRFTAPHNQTCKCTRCGAITIAAKNFGKHVAKRNQKYHVAVWCETCRNKAAAAAAKRRATAAQKHYDLMEELDYLDDMLANQRYVKDEFVVSDSDDIEYESEEDIWCNEYDTNYTDSDCDDDCGDVDSGDEDDSDDDDVVVVVQKKKISRPLPKKIPTFRKRRR